MRPGGASGARQNRRGDRPERLLARRCLRIDRRIEHPPKHTRDVGIDERCACLVRERRDGARGVCPDPRKGLKLDGRCRQASTAPAPVRDRAGEPVEIARSRVVAEALPSVPEARRRRRRHGPQRRKGLKELGVLRNDPHDLCLLEHQLRDEDVRRIACTAPGKIPRGAPIPRTEPPTEPQTGLPRNVRCLNQRDASIPIRQSPMQSAASGVSSEAPR